MKNILFVCTGNTCRSCMAEGILKRMLEESGRVDEFSVLSAGVFADGISRASNNALLVLKNEWGIDISDHISRKLTQDDINWADVVLTMTKAHKDIVLSIYKEYANKVFTLGEYSDIVDPYGGSYGEYKKCAKEIRDSI